MRHYYTLILLLITFNQLNWAKVKAANTNERHRIIVSTDIGGTDPDDFQSMVHLLVYADTFDIEGIISSPFGEGRVKHILEVISKYEIDYPKLSSYSTKYPTPDSLRKIVKQGETEIVSPVGYASSTEGSEWIIKCAKRDDPRPLHILVWGGIEDLAQALHDAPDILPKLRVYWIGGPNKKWSVNAYQYIVDNFPELWIIESNATYRGWFVGGNQSAEWNNKGFVETYVKGFGALGNYFYSKKAEVKMGDTPSLMRLFYGNPDDPAQPSWGGQYVRAWERPHKIINRITTLSDSVEEFGVLELRLPFDTNTVTNPQAKLDIENQSLEAQVKNDTIKFLFSPKKAANWNYTITSNIPSINNSTGQLVSYLTPALNKENPSPQFPNWWVDDPSPEYIENGHIGAKTVNCWRIDYLKDFAKRMYRCKYSANTYYKINFEAQNGKVLINSEDTVFKAGKKITITAIPDVGYKFVGWQGDATCNYPELTITMDSDKNFIALFSPLTTLQLIEDEKILVYPTYINDYVFVSIINKCQLQKSIELFDMSGKLLDYYLLKPGQENTIINTCAYIPGLMVIRIRLGSTFYNKMLVKV